MIRSGVERTKRAASRRIIVRALIVGGFAGAAWLLSASGAQAADAQHEASSVLAPLTGVLGTASEPVLDTASAVVGGVLTPSDHTSAVDLSGATADRSTRVTAPADRTPAAKPERPARHDTDPDAVTTTAPAMARPDRGDTARGLAGTLDELVAPLGVTRVLTGSTGLLSPVSRVVDPVLAPLGVLRPVDAVLRFVAAPLTTTLDAVIRTAGSTSPGRSDRSVSAVTPGRLHGGVIGALSAVAAASVHPRASHTVRVTSIRRSAGPPERTPGVRLGTGDLPDRPAPAPLREQPGTGTGVPAGGPGSHTEGGAFATVPSAVASSMVEVHRLLEPTDAAVLRHHAEDPTVSPD